MKATAPVSPRYSLSSNNALLAAINDSSCTYLSLLYGFLGCLELDLVVVVVVVVIPSRTFFLFPRMLLLSFYC